MADKMMPERLWAWKGCAESRGWSDSNGLHRGSEAYIRADLVPAQGSADEPLEEGEYQWVRLEDKECPWELAQAVYDPFISDDMVLEVDGKTYNFEDVAEFGPVIQPPPCQSN